MNKAEKIKVLETVFDRLTEFTDEGCLVYVCTQSGNIPLTEYDKLLSIIDHPTFGIESIFATRGMSHRSWYESEGKFRFGIKSETLNPQSENDNPNVNKQIRYILRYLPNAIKRLKAELKGFTIETSLSWCVGSVDKDDPMIDLMSGGPYAGSPIKIFKNDPFNVDRTFKAMGYRYPKVNISLQEDPCNITSFQIQFQIAKKEPITRTISNFLKFVSSVPSGGHGGMR